ncbi:unnamed protein product [Durusdinium trenchii]|uniref:NADH dehydrogenase [ubiquinone] 1 beta subcomplex subunit 7 n=1 Tax=Durusdinium trenchii TaxID=1381693 RepID=A0ABP0KR07_9DINO
MAKPPMGEENDEYEDQVAETISLIEELHGTAKFKPLTPMTSSFRQKDVAIGGDPKFREMSHFLTSYSHQERLQTMHRGDESPRKDGIESMNNRARKLALEAKNAESPTQRSFPSSPRFAMAGGTITGAVQSTPSVPSEAKTTVESPRRQLAIGAEAVSWCVRFSSHRAGEDFMLCRKELQRRLKWREELDRNLRRLMTDVELGRDPAMKPYNHRMVCEQFDKRYDWFKDCGDKEVLKEKKGPPFVRYDPAKPVMAGSTRGIPRNT